MITINVTMSTPSRPPVIYPEVHIDSAALEAVAHTIILIHFYRARRRDGMTRIEAARSTGLLIKAL